MSVAVELTEQPLLNQMVMPKLPVVSPLVVIAVQLLFDTLNPARNCVEALSTGIDWEPTSQLVGLAFLEVYAPTPLVLLRVVAP
jgi:hypothetical protein